ncbi:ThiF family adenylyltransferase [Campylobacter sp. RM15925]|uniref:HesA/MoeB/ThiF family protein n=1 Tax=Campylobacter sp. RM15925 TaxID=1705724 RepID=UPI0014739B7A|nr:ThiF family adenylyltransferase [Campylobacter sp. RM15925]
MNYFHRQIQLWGEETQANLASKSIAIIGSGGLGSSLGYALSSSGIGEIHIVDFDEVSVHNIHRQILFDMGDEGKFKAEIFKSRLERRYDGVKITVHACKFDEFATKGLKFDLIIDATDNLKTRAQINEYAKSLDVPWLYGSVESFHGQVCLFDKASLTSAFAVSDIKPAGIAAPIVMFIASFQANLALRYLAGSSVQKDLLYYLDMSSGELNLRKFKLPK